MSGVRAWERLNDPEYCDKLTMVEFEELLVRAGYPQGVAHKAAMQHGWDRLAAGKVM